MSDRKYFIKHSKKYNICAPHIKNVKTKKNKKQTKSKSLKEKTSIAFDDTCLDKKTIKQLIKNYNATYKNNKIKRNKLSIMFEELKEKVSGSGSGNNSSCNHNNKEICVVNHKFVSPKLKMKIRDNYKPIMPNEWYKDKNTWLNTLDIDAVFEQYEKKYPEFVFYGPTPIDFDKKFNDYQCVDNELCRINIPKLYKNGIRYIGVVFNLDSHDKPGSHWISMFCNLNKKEVCYWDSYAHEPPQEVKDLMHKIKDQAKKIGKNIKIKITSNRHQYGNSECGVYSTHFIINLLEGGSFEKLTKNRIPDEVMNSYRSKYFLPL